MEFNITLDFYSGLVVMWVVALVSSIAMLSWLMRKDRRDRLEARIREFCRKWL